MNILLPIFMALGVGLLSYITYRNYREDKKKNSHTHTKESLS